MKQRSRLFGNWVVVILAFVGLLSLTACEHDLGEDDAMMYTISGNASGNQILPTGTGTGTITGTFNQNTNQLNYTITYTGIAGTAQSGHFYIGMPGAVGSTSRPFSAGTVTSTANGYTGQIRLTRDEEMQLLNGNLYYTISSSGRSGLPSTGGKITAVRR